MKDVVARAPVGLFGIVMGLAGLGTAWRTAHAVWGLPAAIGEVILGLAASVWLILLALYAMKWLSNRSAALAEFRHPVQSCIVAFVPMATMLIAIAARPYAASAALGLFVVGSAASLALAVCHTASLSKGARDPDAVTPALVLPVVGFCYVSAIAAGAFGYVGSGQILFGAGFLAWLPIEAAIRFRLFARPELPPLLRPTMGILLAPPSVGAVAYLSTAPGPPDRTVVYLIGYGLLQMLLLARLLPWIAQLGFSASWWAFSFGIDALATAPMLYIQHGGGGPLAALAPILFVFANLAIGALSIGTTALLVQGRLIPKPV